MTIGTLIMRRRNAHGYSQKYLGAVSGVDPSVISAIEVQGHREVSWTIILRLAKTLELTLEELQACVPERKPYNRKPK